MINIKFTPRVGVAPGTTTMAIDGTGSDTLCRNLGASDAGPCLPEAPDSYMSSPSRYVPPGTPGATQASIPYGTESELKGRHMLSAHMIDYRQTPGLGAHLVSEMSPPHYRRPSASQLSGAPFGMSWQGFAALIGAAVVGGGALAYLSRRR